MKRVTCWAFSWRTVWFLMTVQIWFVPFTDMEWDWTSSPSYLQPTCMGPSRNERPPVQQSGNEVSGCQQGWRQQSFHRFWCLLPATQTGEKSTKPPRQNHDNGIFLPGCFHTAKLLVATVTSEGCRHRGTWNCWRVEPRVRSDLRAWNSGLGLVPAGPPDHWHRRSAALTPRWKSHGGLKHQQTDGTVSLWTHQRLSWLEWSLTQVSNVVSQLTAFSTGVILHRLLTRCSQDVGVDGR